MLVSSIAKKLPCLPREVISRSCHKYSKNCLSIDPKKFAPTSSNDNIGLRQFSRRTHNGLQPATKKASELSSVLVSKKNDSILVSAVRPEFVSGIIFDMIDRNAIDGTGSTIDDMKRAIAIATILPEFIKKINNEKYMRSVARAHFENHQNRREVVKCFSDLYKQDHFKGILIKALNNFKEAVKKNNKDELGKAEEALRAYLKSILNLAEQNTIGPIFLL